MFSGLEDWSRPWRLIFELSTVHYIHMPLVAHYVWRIACLRNDSAESGRIIDQLLRSQASTPTSANEKAGFVEETHEVKTVDPKSFGAAVGQRLQLESAKPSSKKGKKDAKSKPAGNGLTAKVPKGHGARKRKRGKEADQ